MSVWITCKNWRSRAAVKNGSDVTDDSRLEWRNGGAMRRGLERKFRVRSNARSEENIGHLIIHLASAYRLRETVRTTFYMKKDLHVAATSSPPFWEI